MRKVILVLFAVVFIIIQGDEGIGADTFIPDASAWKSEVNIPIAKILAKHKIKGCGQMRWQQNTQQLSEDIIQCAPNGTYDVEYLVFTAVEKIEGPYKPGGKY